jgi:Cytochrome c554 and c-prime
MHCIAKYRFYVLTLFTMLLCVTIFTKCINNTNNKSVLLKNSNYEKFAGSDKCISCHKSIYDTHLHTAHFLTSTIANEKSIKGSFDSAKNTFVYNNGSLMRMEKRGDGFYQAAYINGVEKKSQRFDMVIGSGTKGQSYATWQNNKLLQLPLTYFTNTSSWCNSPGYPNKIAFNRPITSRCMECHATFVQKITEDAKGNEDFDRDRIILGVDCEKCHGPAEKHVQFQTAHPKETKAQFIINPASFSRQQNLDLCALCHGGRLQKTKPSFEFTAGDRLSDYFFLDTTYKDANNIDVHGNQYGLMAASKCFKMSNTLTCNTCHNTHENEKGNITLFSQRCISCHNNEHPEGLVCKLSKITGTAIKTNCIDCHMPKQPSMAIAVLLQGATGPLPALIRSHYIKVYPDETKKVLAYFKNR